MQKQNLLRLAQAMREKLEDMLRKKMQKNAADSRIKQDTYALFYRLTAVYYMLQNGFLSMDAIQENFLSLHRMMPQAFDCYEPDISLFTDDLISQLKALFDTYLPKEAVQNQPEIIGWLHQYYHSADKHAAFRKRESGKIASEELTAATQLFTPEWVAAYLVQNSVGKLLQASFPTHVNPSEWDYHIADAAENDAAKRLTDRICSPVKLSQLTIIDPCMGSGHLLTQSFDLLMHVYLSCGYDAGRAARFVLTKNLYGLDIDPTVVQVANFQLLMKACAYDPSICQSPIPTNLRAVMPAFTLPADAPKALTALMDAYADANTAGSLLSIPALDAALLQNQVDALPIDAAVKNKLSDWLQTAKMLSMQYDAVITNPPYMGKKNIHPALSDYLAENYPQAKSELYAAFMQRCLRYTRQGGYTAMVTVHSWMFLRSFVNLRQQILNQTTISSLLHTGAGTFDEISTFNVLAAAFCLRKEIWPGYRSKFIYLGDYSDPAQKILHFFDPQHSYLIDQQRFARIPGMPFVYRLSEKALRQFEKAVPLGSIAPPRQGMATSDNARFVRYWFEVDRNNICFDATDSTAALQSQKRFFPYNKGGFYRKWYGMNEYVVDYEEDGKRLKAFDRAVLRNKNDYFKSGITWSLFGFQNFGVRYKPCGFLFDVSGSSMFPNEAWTYYILAFLASKAAFLYLSVLAPTVNFQIGNIADLPFLMDEQIKPQIDALAKDCIKIAKADWDDDEMSWAFVSHPLMRYGEGNLLCKRYEAYQAIMTDRYNALKQNEQRINALFIGLYELQEDITPELDPRDISVKTPDAKRDIRAFLSYIVGCLLGRYPCAVPTVNLLCFSKPDAPNGILTQLKCWLTAHFGEESLQENLSFLTLHLEGKGSAEELLCRYFTKHFYTEHMIRYQKHPIYFLFDSGEKHAYTALFAMHRYQPQYLSEVNKAVQDLLTLRDLPNDSCTELMHWQQDLKMLMDDQIILEPNDGVSANHQKLSALLAPIRQPKR